MVRCLVDLWKVKPESPVGVSTLIKPLLSAEHSSILGIGPRRQWLGVSVALKAVPAAET